LRSTTRTASFMSSGRFTTRRRRPQSSMRSKPPSGPKRSRATSPSTPIAP
jgi:hypothetical protein